MMLSWYQGAWNVPRKSLTPLYHHQPGPLIQGRMELSCFFFFFYSKFWPYHARLNQIMFFQSYIVQFCLALAKCLKQSGHFPLIFGLQMSYFCSKKWHSLEIVFFFLKTILFKAYRWLCGKSSVDQQSLKYADQLFNHLSSSFWCSAWTSAGSLDHVNMPKSMKL